MSAMFPTASPEPESSTVENSQNISFPFQYDPLNPCPRQLWELIIGLLFSCGIIVSNSFCIKLKVQQQPRHHPENKLFVLNLAISNLLCGMAIFVSNILDLYSHYNQTDLTLPTCLLICYYWAPAFIFFVMLPYVALASLGIDIAYYCHHSMDYHRRMSRTRLWATLLSGWVYTLAVVCLTVIIVPGVLCDKDQWELNINFIVFPILLMFVPATFVMIIFVYIMRNYWKNSQHLARRMSLSSTMAFNSDSKSRLVRKFIKKFLHVIVFSILCGLVFTFLTITEVILEQRHKRVCMLYKLDRMSVSLNALLAPWFYCLATKQFRKKFYRQSIAWWSNRHFSIKKSLKCNPQIRKCSSTKDLPLGRSSVENNN